MMTPRDYREKSLLRIFVSYFRPHWKLFLLDMACAQIGRASCRERVLLIV